MARLALVANASDLTDRVESWLHYEHLITRVQPDFPAGLEAFDLVVVVIPRQPGGAALMVDVFKHISATAAVVLTGDLDRCPSWIEGQALHKRNMVSVFPASPAALQVTTRNLKPPKPAAARLSQE